MNLDYFECIEAALNFVFKAQNYRNDVLNWKLKTPAEREFLIIKHLVYF